LVGCRVAQVRDFQGQLLLIQFAEELNVLVIQSAAPGVFVFFFRLSAPDWLFMSFPSYSYSFPTPPPARK
jgi:hypothetical protein